MCATNLKRHTRHTEQLCDKGAGAAPTQKWHAHERLYTTNIACYANAAEIGQVVGRAPGRYEVIRQNKLRSTLAALTSLH